MVILAVPGVFGAYLATVLFGGTGGNAAATMQKPADHDLVAHGAYLTSLGDCKK